MIIKIKRISFSWQLTLMSLIILSLGLSVAISSPKVFAWSTPLQPCSGIYFGICVGVGYFSGQTEGSIETGGLFGYGPVNGVFPFNNGGGNYADTSFTPSGTSPQWAFPATPVGCGISTSSAACSAYTSTFISQMGQYLCGPGHVPPGGPCDPITNNVYNGETLGAAMIIETMLGQNSGGTGYKGQGWLGPKTGVIDAYNNFATWESLVISYANQGLINWDSTKTFIAPFPDSTGLARGATQAVHNSTSPYGGVPGCNGPGYAFSAACGPILDDEFTQLSGNVTANVISFLDPTGSHPVIYNIDRLCGNIIGNNSHLRPITWTNVPSLSLDTLGVGAQVYPGQTLAFAPGMSNTGNQDGPGVTLDFYETGNGINNQYVVNSNQSVLDGRGDPYVTSAAYGPDGSFPFNHYYLNRSKSPASGQADWSVQYHNYIYQISPTAPAGAVICFTNTISTTSAASPGPSSVTSSCYTVASQPYFKVTNGSVTSGASFCPTSSPPSAASIYSWNHNYSGSSSYTVASGNNYGVFATGLIKGFDTNQGISDGELAFANNSSPNNSVGDFGGNFQSLNCMHDYYGDAPSLSPSPGIWTIPGAGGVFSYNGNLSINPSTVSGRSIIYVKGDVTILGDIKYSTMTPATLATIPKVEIIASGSIRINPSVVQLDGMYIAEPNGAPFSGYIYTCNVTSAGNVGLSNNCGNPLTVNGSLVGDTVKFWRTPGSVESGTAAETINYSPLDWLTPSGSGVNNDSITSLPPNL
jgi:hypothetical protein